MVQNMFKIDNKKHQNDAIDKYIEQVNVRWVVYTQLQVCIQLYLMLDQFMAVSVILVCSGT